MSRKSTSSCSLHGAQRVGASILVLRARSLGKPCLRPSSCLWIDGGEHSWTRGTGTNIVTAHALFLSQYPFTRNNMTHTFLNQNAPKFTLLPSLEEMRPLLLPMHWSAGLFVLVYWMRLRHVSTRCSPSRSRVS